jgi:hypothetical protein
MVVYEIYGFILLCFIMVAAVIQQGFMKYEQLTSSSL